MHSQLVCLVPVGGVFYLMSLFENFGIKQVDKGQISTAKRKTKLKFRRLAFRRSAWFLSKFVLNSLER